jgi:hypothetical protein
MGTWTRTNGVWTLAADATPTCVIAPDLFSPTSAYKLYFADCTHGTRLVIFADALGLSAFAVGLDATGTGGDAVVTKRTLGGAPSTVANAAHGLTAGQPGFFEVRVNAGTIELRLNGATSPVLTYAIPGSDPLLSYMHWGFEADDNGAQVLSLESCTLLPLLADRADVLFAVCDGNVWMATSRAGIRSTAPAAFKSGGRVSLLGYHQDCYGVDGETPRKISLTTGAAATWTLSAGSHLGGASNTTKATDLSVYNDRIVQFGDPADPQNALYFRVGDPLDANTAGDGRGKAWVLSGQGGRVGSPITAMLQAGNGVQIIGTVDGIWRLIGDPSLGAAIDLGPLMADSGISGPDAIKLVDRERVVAHGPVGAMVMQGASYPSNFSEQVLTDGIQIDRLNIATYQVQVQRDAARKMVYFFLTPIGGGDTIHFAYEERVGGFSDRGGGFQPWVLPARIGPTASCVWLGSVIMGTRDGYLVEFADGVHDDDGEAVELIVPCAIMRGADLEMDAVLESLELLLGQDSGPVTVEVHRGRTAEEAYAALDAEKRYAADVSYPGRLLVQKARGRALVARITNSNAEAVVIEEVNAQVVQRKVIPAGNVAPESPPEQSPPNPTTSTDTGGPGPGGPPDGVCQECADWIAMQEDLTTFNFKNFGYEPGVFDAIAVSVFEFLEEAQALVAQFQERIINAGICDMPEDFYLAVVMTTAEGTEYVRMTVSEFLALTTGSPGTDKFEVYWACDIQEEPSVVCEPCANWMELNTTEVFATMDVYRFPAGGGNLNSLAALQAGLPTWIETIVNAGICGIDEASDVVIRWANQLHVNTGTLTYTEFMALVDSPDIGFPFSGWIMFACEDQP